MKKQKKEKITPGTKLFCTRYQFSQFFNSTNYSNVCVMLYSFIFVNVVVYAIAEKVWNWNNVIISTLFAWVISLIVAYILNKIIVFETKGLSKKELLKEIWSFFIFRVISGIIDIGFMKITVDIFKFNDVWMKIISNIIVIVINYIFSKFIIFKKNDL